MEMNYEEAEGLPRRCFPVESFDGTRSGLDGLNGMKSNLVAESVDFVGRRVRRAEPKPICEGEKQELVGRRNVFSRGLSGRIAVETSGEASERRFKSTEGDAAKNRQQN